MTRWNLQAVEKAAPDPASLTAGRKLALPGPWSETGSTDTLVWGRCQGSGKAPYQVSIDLNGPAYRCTCPSRKFPCKHAIALLLLWVQGEGTIAEVAEGADFARVWAETRAERAARAAEPAEAKTVDPASRAKRLEERLRLMDAGVEDFALWLADVVRAGIVDARRRPLSWWDATAARLVDAQLPGLAEQVRDVGSGIHRRDDWAELILDSLGRWWTTVGAWRQRDELDPRSLADLRVAVGWPMATDEVRADDAMAGLWQVLGAHRSDDGRLQQQRTWLRERSSGETVLVLDFAARGNPLPAARLVGSVLDSTLARYPGSWPRRALFASEPSVVEQSAVLPAGATLGAGLDSLRAAWALNPWTARVPVLLTSAACTTTHVRDAEGMTMPLLSDGADQLDLLAVTGGQPVPLFGELEAGGFRPLTVDVEADGGAR